MIESEKFKAFFELVPKFTVNAQEILRLIEFIKDNIDENNSIFEKEDEYVILRLSSKSGRSCPLNFALPLSDSSDKSISFYLKDDGQLIFNEIIEGKQELQCVVSFIKKLLSHEIKEEKIYVKKKLCRLKYYYFIEEDGKDKVANYLAINRLIWPWEKKRKEIRIYEPWL